MQVIESRPTHDVVVIGSGAAGGMAAYNLTRLGVKVLILDAGAAFDKSDLWTHVLPFEADARIRAGEVPPAFRLDTNEQPYLTPDDKLFDLIRVWGLGGKTNIWGRVSLRMSDLDFGSAELDGWGIPWPIRYADLAPYYDRVDQLIGVCGGDDDSDVLPGSRYHMPAAPPRCNEVLLKAAAESRDIPVVAKRSANLTRPHRGFEPCHYCGACGRGCGTASFFTSTEHLIPFALETGNLEIRSNAVVSRILVDDEGRARGVQHFDRLSGVESQVDARVVVVGASAMDSTRILLNSTSRQHPTGLGNSSDQLGRNFCEQIRTHVTGFLPQLYGRPYQNDDGIGGSHIYIPRFNHRRPNRDYLRGYGIQLWNSRTPTTGTDVARHLSGFGEGFKAEVKNRYTALVSMHPYGEVLPRPENRVTVDPERTDRYGVPLMKIDVAFGDNEFRMLDEMYATCEEILHAAGAEIAPFDREAYDIAGTAIHEHGTCRMGDDPRQSVLNAHNQMHDVDNVFVVDGSAFTTASEKNPTLSILALSWRASDYLAEELRRGNL